MSRNVAAKVKLSDIVGSQAGRKHHETLSFGQVALYIELAATGTVYGPVLVLACAGLRHGEMTGIRWCDVDFENGTVFVSQTVTANTPKGRPALKDDPKNKGSRAIISIPDDVMGLLVQHRDRQKLSGTYSLKGLVFPSQSGTPIEPNNLRRTHYALLKEAGIDKHVTIHGMRHTFATRAKDASMSIVDIAHVLRHSRPSTTADFYTWSDGKAARKVVEAVNMAVNHAV